MRAVREIVALDVAKVKIGQERLRSIDPIYVAAMVETINDAHSDPLPPIEVYRLPGSDFFEVADGAHRLTAHQLAELETIEAIIGSSAHITRRQTELQRNLFTRSLDAVEMAGHVAEIYYLERRKRGLSDDEDPRKLGGRPHLLPAEESKKTRADLSQVSLPQSVADAVNLGQRDVQRYLMLFRLLRPSALMLLRQVNHPTLRVRDQLLKLASQMPETQVVIAQMLVADPRANVNSALNTLNQKPTADPEMKRLSTFVATFGRMGDTEKRAALTQLLDAMTDAMQEGLVAMLKERGAL